MGRLSFKLRPAGEFFDASTFSVPSGGAKALAERVQTNVVYYQANYAALLLLFMAYVCVAKPSFAVVLALSGAAGYYVFAVQQGPAMVQGVLLTRQTMARAWGALSLVLFLAFGRTTVLFALLFGLVLILAHSSFRRRSMRARGSNFVGGGTTPLGAAFKSLDDVLHGSDDDEEVVAGVGRAADMENPSGAPPRGPAAAPPAASAYPTAYPQAYPGAVPGQQAHYRNNFRAQMRAKYQQRP